MQNPGIQRKADGCTSTEICQDIDCHTRDYTQCKETHVYETPWEADHWFGCLCDDGYTGYDCSLRTCADGDDPLTDSQNNDVQLIECHADFGTFTLSFGRETTAPISVDASVADLTNALNMLPSLVGQDPKVSVSWTGGISQVCVASGNQIQVTFLQNFGDQVCRIFDSCEFGYLIQGGDLFVVIVLFSLSLFQMGLISGKLQLRTHLSSQHKKLSLVTRNRIRAATMERVMRQWVFADALMIG